MHLFFLTKLIFQSPRLIYAYVDTFDFYGSNPTICQSALLPQGASQIARIYLTLLEYGDKHRTNDPRW